MLKNDKKLRSSFTSDKKAASYAISAVIITATTIVLVLVASSYAYQLLDKQRGQSEFEIVQKSMISFDDALKDIAWSLHGSRSVWFSTEYGQLTLLPDDDAHGLPLLVSVLNHPEIESYSDRTGYVKYSISTKYVTFGNSGYNSYVLGDEKTIITQGSEGLGRLFVEQQSDTVTSTLSYRVKAIETSTINVNDVDVSYVDVWIVKLKISNYLSIVGDLDLVARANIVDTITSDVISLGSNECTIHAEIGNNASNQSIKLSSDTVVFNFIISEVEVSP